MSTGYYNYAAVAYGSNNEVHFYCMQMYSEYRTIFYISKRTLHDCSGV